MTETEPYLNEKLSGTKTLLMGQPGTGKTYSIATLLAAGLEVFDIITDPGGDETILDAIATHNLPLEKFHYHYIAPAPQGWDALSDMARKINAMNYKDLTEIKSGVGKQDYKQFLELLDCLANFTDDRTGEQFGPVDDFPPSYALVLDSISGVNTMAMDMTIGAKPAAHQGEWGVAMNALEKLITKLVSDTRCFLVITTHLDKEMDEVLGKPQFMPALLGRKLAPKIPRLFSDVVLATKEGNKFYWDTIAHDVALKARNLPFSDKIEPSFVQIVERWKVRHMLGLNGEEGGKTAKVA